MMASNSIRFLVGYSRLGQQVRSLCSNSIQRGLQCQGFGSASSDYNPHRQQQRPVLPNIHWGNSAHCVRSFSQHKSKKPKSGRESGSDSDSDSDSDNEFRERGKFWLRKMRTLHGLLDLNKDGVISFDDYQLLAKKFSDLGHLSPAASKEFHEVMEKLWEEQWGEISPYNLIPVEKYLSEMQHVLHDKSLKKKVHRFLPYLFQAVDKDGSGLISLKEFTLFFKCLGLSEQDASKSFAAIDENNDGSLSIKEFVKLGRDYFITEDERRVSRDFWGPLVKQ